ncbi:phytanoyl-CoA dioxygenase family protein [uncultured Litoreibacter sp.]|uniref:phytanoyl-CoA dioxygenase family protein n=1 Tax=uncultured Litoreibacter sp. TaxID=1392394 RepID=UPI00260A7F9B|nr:phytanoyl-CoA dioxygenase family protein [uncultured Litoreibacter sp.]
MLKSTKPPVWLTDTSGSLDDLKRLVEQDTDKADYPLASAIEQNTVIYAGDTFRTADRTALMTELNRVFDLGPGIVAIKGAISDRATLDAATQIFEQFIEDERGTGGGDHFAKPGANDRVWNAAQKHCLKDPANFAKYFDTPAIDLPCRAWLGEGYQLTAQVNRVNPGGAAQTAHRDYHLGFMPSARVATYPAQVHALSPLLTLQGAIAHCDMPLETGPTLYLPYSHQMLEGYVAFQRDDFQRYFEANRTQLPLEKGDAVFFNPAVMHGAGTNTTTDKFRLANLLQIGSPFGRSIEGVDRAAMCKALYPVLRSHADPHRVIAASAEGYAFPTNLDRDPPIGGLIPESQAEFMSRALSEGMSEDAFVAQLDAQAERKLP